MVVNDKTELRWVYLLHAQICDHPQREKLIGVYRSADKARIVQAGIKEFQTRIEQVTLDEQPDASA